MDVPVTIALGGVFSQKKLLSSKSTWMLILSQIPPAFCRPSHRPAGALADKIAPTPFALPLYYVYTNSN